MSALISRSPEAFFHTNSKASLSNHIFSPLPATVYLPLLGSNVAEPAWRTAPTSPLPSKIPSRVSSPPEPAKHKAVARTITGRTNSMVKDKSFFALDRIIAPPFPLTDSDVRTRLRALVHRDTPLSRCFLSRLRLLCRPGQPVRIRHEIPNQSGSCE